MVGLCPTLQSCIGIGESPLAASRGLQLRSARRRNFPAGLQDGNSRPARSRIERRTGVLPRAAIYLPAELCLFPRFPIVEDPHENAKTVRSGPLEHGFSPAATAVVAEEPKAVPTPNDPAAFVPGIDTQAYQQAVDRAIEFLQTKAQAADGSYAATPGPGVTGRGHHRACCGTAARPDDPLVAKSLKYLEGFVQPDGGIYADRTASTATTKPAWRIMCFAEANATAATTRSSRTPSSSSKASSGTRAKGTTRSSTSYGGAGYGKHKRPDLSNTQLPDRRPAGGRQRARRRGHARRPWSSSRAARTWRASTTRPPFAAKNPDGGFYYTPAAGGESMAGKTPNGGLRSYGSMTYAGLKSMIYAGVGPDDPRVKAAVEVDPEALRPADQSRHGRRRAVLLLPHVRQGAGRDGRRTASRTPRA